jgi:DNA-binding LacI/PurR family transcriptional regulator
MVLAGGGAARGSTTVGTEQQRLQTEAQLRQLLRQPAFRPGDRLPGERELATTLGVGRTALRPVVEKLIAEGALERRAQSGTYLCRRPLPAVGTGTVAVIAPLQASGARGAWLHQVVSAFERTIAPSGIKPLLLNQSSLAEDPCSVKRLVKQAIAERARVAVLIHPLGTREKIACALALLQEASVHPLVVSSRSYGGLASYVYFDSQWGAYLATRHLLQQGHRAIGFAGAAAGHEWVQERLRGCRQALSTLDIEPRPEWEWLAEPGERRPAPEDGAGAAQALLPVEELTAVVAVNDIVALGFWEACRQRGAGVPDQLSLVGFDNDPESLAAGLTTVERPSAAVGEAAAQVALERIAGQEGNTVSVHLRPVLIERSSVVPLAQGDSVLTAEMPRAQRKASFKGPFSASSASLR